MSLNAHLTAGTAEHGRLRFHPDCPRCRAQRLAGALGGDSLVSRRTQAGLATGLLAFSAVAAPASAQVPNAGQEEEAPGGEPPGLQPDLDLGGADTFDYETAPVPGGRQAGGEEDEGEGAPVDNDPTFDPEAPLPPEEAAPPPASAPPPPPTAPESVPVQPQPPPAPPPVASPAPEPPAESPGSPATQRPAAEVDQPAPKPEPGRTPREGRTVERRTETPDAEGQPVLGTAPAPAAGSPAPFVEPEAAPSPSATAEPSEPASPSTAPVSRRGEPAKDPIRGRSYTVRPGDSLWSIARRLLGPGATAGEIAREVNRLWELNRDRIGTGDRNLIHVGTVLEL